MSSIKYFVLTTLMLIKISQCDVPPLIELSVTATYARHNIFEINPLADIAATVNLECRTTFDHNFVSFEWELPENWTIALETVEVKNNSYYKTINKIMSGFNLTANNYHVYLCKCKAIHKEWNYTIYSDNKYIHIADDQRCYTTLIEDITSENFKIPEITVEVKIFSCVSTDHVSWLTPNATLIDETFDRFIIGTVQHIWEQKYNYVTKLHFKNITTEDFGFYTLTLGRSSTDSTDIYINLNKEKPNVRLSVHNLTEDGEIVIYECMAAANPKPNIKWRFHKCAVSDCLDERKYNLISSSEELSEMYHLDNGLQVISYVALNLSESSGFLRCISGNSEGTSEAKETTFFVENGFDIFVKTDKLENNTLYVGYGKVIDIFCSVSLYNYVKQIRWFVNGREVQKHSIHYSFKNYKNLDKYVEIIEFRYVKEDQSGNYTCEVMNRNGEIHSKVISLNPKRI